MKTKIWFIATSILFLSIISFPIHSEDEMNLKMRYARPVVNEPLLNKTNEYRLKLGKTLFFDPRLSGSNWISCATCHNPSMGWSDGLTTAIGDGQKTLKRSTPTILNSAYNHLQMWDGRFRTLEEQALSPIESKHEMNQDLDELVDELKAIPGYKMLFSDAYPGRGISKDTIALALAAFQRSIISTDAPFDRWVRDDTDAMSDAAIRGFKVFEGKGRCAKCHSGFNFADDSFHNIGLKSDDIGRFSVIPLSVTKGAFKTPTLRNIAETAPYMHNGSYATLDEVIEHYIRGGDDTSHMSANMKKINLNKSEKDDLIAFLNMLTSPLDEIMYPDMPH